MIVLVKIVQVLFALSLLVLIHEFGHFYEFYTYGDEATAQLDVDEIHSQANELLFLPVYFLIAYVPLNRKRILVVFLVVRASASSVNDR